MATKKASPAQLAARKKFAEMAKNRAFKKRKSNPRKINSEKIIAGEQIITLGNNYFASIKLTSYNDYYVLIFKKVVETNGFVSEDVVHDYKPRIFVREKSAVASVMRYATKNLKTNPTKQRKTKPTAVMANPVKNKRTYTVYCQAPGQAIHIWTKLATFYSATAAKQYANAYAKINKSHYVRVESHG